MADNHNTSLEIRLENAFKHIMEDRKLVKRLRYTAALMKIGANISVKQAELLSMDIIPHLDKQGILLEDYELNEELIASFQSRCINEAWNSGTLETNFALLKIARIRQNDTTI